MSVHGTGRRTACLIERFRPLLPVSEQTPVISLGEGSTPLLRAPRLGAQLGVDLHLKLEGANPTGSFKDRGMTMAVSKAVEEGAEAVICASTGNTSASAAAYAARAGLRCVVVVPDGGVAIGKLAQAIAYGATVVRVSGSFDDALRLVREVAAIQPITLVNNLNPYRLIGQRTAAWEIVDELGDGPDWLVLPVGNAGNITAYWDGFCAAAEAGATATLPRLLGCQATGSAAIVEGIEIARPQTVASAIRIGAPVRRAEAERARAESRGAFRAVTDEEILGVYALVASSEGRLLRAVERDHRGGARPRRRRGPGGAGGRVVCVLTGNGLKDPESAVALAGEATVIPASLDTLVEIVTASAVPA